MMKDEDILIVHTLTHKYMTKTYKVELMNAIQFEKCLIDKMRFIRDCLKLKYLHLSDEELIKILKKKTISRKKLQKYQDFSTLYYIVLNVIESIVDKILIYDEDRTDVMQEMKIKLLDNVNSIKRLDKLEYNRIIILYNLIEELELCTDKSLTVDAYNDIRELTTIEKTKILADKFNLS